MFNKTLLISYLESLTDKDEVARNLILRLKHKYSFVYTHCLNVSISSYLLCYNMNLTIDESISIALGAFLHDIGKLNLPLKPLHKYREFSLKEHSLLKQHPFNGVNLLNNSQYINIILNSILYHHERYDGNGYPSKLKEKEIPLQARIVAICDYFVDMISQDNYKSAYSLENAKKKLIRNKDTQFDGEIVDNFLEIADDFYNNYYNVKSSSYIRDFMNTEGYNTAEEYSSVTSRRIYFSDNEINTSMKDLISNSSNDRCQYTNI